ncbi:MAG: hypothetical protein KIT62_14305 [Cyclobacteriaceae bacterium]|nr:hypothetical protein [Cyclobacteriaceae bacterium]
MKLFLQIELSKWQDTGYEKPLLNYASGLSADVIGAELDNQSDASIADLVIRLCDQVQSVFVLVQAQPQEPLGASLKLINHLLRSEKKIHKVVLRGEHEGVQKFFQSLATRFVSETDIEKIKTEIKQFALA